LEQGALVEPLAIGAYAARLSGALRGRAIGILGAGPIGVSVLLAARQAGAASIVVVEPMAARRAFARAAGASAVCAPDAPLAAGLLASDPGGLDGIFECCG
jgi:(R,R)-butanediol dehydrogenase/meso-butanediol dehydrogenase/diacetyl reductase